jgi:dihydroorotase
MGVLMERDLFIQNGYLVNPGENKEGYADLLIRKGRVFEIFFYGENQPLERQEASENAEVIDATGMYIFPGLVDAHSHFRDPGFTYKEDIESGAKAAAAGGYTSVVLMCNTNPVVDDVQTLSYVLEKGKNTDIHVYSCGSVSIGLKGEILTDMDALKRNGAVGFTDDGIPLMDVSFLEKAMKKSASLQMPISLHEEDKTLIAQNGINRGKASEFYGVEGSPKEAEISLVKRDLEIAKKTGAYIDVQHVSAKESVELIREAVSASLERRIHAEATPQHFTLTEDALIEIGANAKLNPPLRGEEDRLAIIEGLRDNTIDMIATDHAPHSMEEKSRPITEAPSGMIGLETALSLSYEKLVLEAGIPLIDVIAKLTCNPSNVYGLNAGVVEEGKCADLCIFDPNAEYEKKTFASKSWNSPFIGRKMKGRVVMTICKGKKVYQESEG